MKTYLHILQLHAKIKKISYPNILIKKNIELPTVLWNQSTNKCDQHLWTCLFQQENNGELGYELNSVQFQLYLFISSMAHFHQESIKQLVVRKYLLMSQSITNIFLSTEIKDNIRKIFQRAQRTYLALAHFANIVRYKIGKEKIETDLRMDTIDISSKYSMCLYHNGSKYFFVLSDLVNIIQTSITNSLTFFPNPLSPKNPFNNLPFTQTNLYNIYFRIKYAFTTIPQWLHLFFLSEFNLYTFLLENEQVLREQYIKNYVNNSSIELLYDDLDEMFDIYKPIFDKINIHDEFPKKDLIEIFRPYIYIYIVSKNAIKGTDKRRLASFIIRQKLDEFVLYNCKFGRKNIIVKYIPKVVEDISNNAPMQYTPPNYEELLTNRELDNEEDDVETSGINSQIFRRRYISTVTFNMNHPKFTMNDSYNSFDKKKWKCISRYG